MGVLHMLFVSQLTIPFFPTRAYIKNTLNTLNRLSEDLNAANKEYRFSVFFSVFLKSGFQNTLNTLTENGKSCSESNSF